MPTGALVSCPVSRCPETFPRGGQCPRHPRATRRAWARDPAMASPGQRYHTGSGWAWDRLRARVLQRDPRCRLCGAPSCEVDHITPASRGGTSELTNLRGVCAACHLARRW